MRRRRLHRRERNARRKKIFVFSIALLLLMSAGYAAYNTNININAKANIKKQKASQYLKSKVVTSGDGLYSDYTESNRYVFKGANPDNYIKLGNDLYRIMGVESDGALKVVKNESIGSYSFDPGYSTIISGVTSSNSTDGTRYSSTSTDYCYVSSASSYYGCKAWGSKTTTLNSSGVVTSKMSKEVGGTEYDLPDTEAYLNTYLNGPWYNNLSSYVRAMLTDHIFNIGSIEDEEDNITNTLIQESTYKWKGKVGLISVSDYILANTNENTCDSIWGNNHNKSTCRMTNYIFSLLEDMNSWTISPMCTFTEIGGVDVNGDYASNTEDIFPVLYLSSDVVLYAGNGTETDPYIPGLK